MSEGGGALAKSAGVLDTTQKTRRIVECKGLLISYDDKQPKLEWKTTVTVKNTKGSEYDKGKEFHTGASDYAQVFDGPGGSVVVKITELTRALELMLVEWEHQKRKKSLAYTNLWLPTDFAVDTHNTLLVQVSPLAQPYDAEADDDPDDLKRSRVRTLVLDFFLAQTDGCVAMDLKPHNTVSFKKSIWRRAVDLFSGWYREAMRHNYNLPTGARFSREFYLKSTKNDNLELMALDVRTGVEEVIKKYFKKTDSSKYKVRLIDAPHWLRIKSFYDKIKKDSTGFEDNHIPFTPGHENSQMVLFNIGLLPVRKSAWTLMQMIYQYVDDEDSLKAHSDAFLEKMSRRRGDWKDLNRMQFLEVFAKELLDYCIEMFPDDEELYRALRGCYDYEPSGGAGSAAEAATEP